METPTVARRLAVMGTAAGVLSVGALLGAPSAQAALTTREALEEALEDYLATRIGTVGLALYDRRTRAWFTRNNITNQTLSTVKVLILATALRRSQETGRALTSSQKYLAARMIEYSDNSATDTLLAQVGVANVQRVTALFGLTATRIQGMSSGWWGYSTSSPVEMVKLENQLVWGNPVLTAANSGYIRTLQRLVTPTQRWGAIGLLPSGLTDAENKNGWGPMSGGYRLNSIGHVYGYGRDYNLALYSRSPHGFSYGRDTLNRVGRIVYDRLVDPLS